MEADTLITMLKTKAGGISPRGVIGGPPCQPFSMGNVSNSSSNGNAAKRTLPGRYALLLKALNDAYQLDFFVFENVQGITSEKHRQDFSRFKVLFEDAGFHLFEGLLDAQYYGVPQKRPRVFVVGWNKDKYKGWDFRFPAPRPDPVKTVAQTISGLQEPIFYEQGLDMTSFPCILTIGRCSQNQNDSEMEL